MNLHRIVIAAAGAVSFSLGSFAFAQSSPQPGAAPESQTTSQAPATPVIIIEVQKKLASEGYDPGAADGVWGPQTEAAVRNFQQDQNLDATGQLDADTLAILIVPADSATEEAASPPRAQSGNDSGAADQQPQGGSSASEGASGQPPSQSGQQPPNRQ